MRGPGACANCARRPGTGGKRAVCARSRGGAPAPPPRLAMGGISITGTN